MALQQHPATIADLGVDWQIEGDDALSSRAGLSRLTTLLDRYAVVRLTSPSLLSASTVAAVARHLGDPTPARNGKAPTVPGHDILVDLTVPAKRDDGRARAAAVQEFFHFDYVEGRPAAYSILYFRNIPPNRPMRFIDMRGVSADLSPDLADRLDGLTHGTGKPFLTGHPRTGARVLSLPPRQSKRVAGMNELEAAELVDALWALVDGSPRRHQADMRPGDLFVWDGLAAAHDNPVFPRSVAREVWFVTLPAPEQPAAASGDPV